MFFFIYEFILCIKYFSTYNIYLKRNKLKQKITVEITQYALKGLRGRVISSDNGSRGRAKSPKVPCDSKSVSPPRMKSGGMPGGLVFLKN